MKTSEEMLELIKENKLAGQVVYVCDLRVGRNVGGQLHRNIKPTACMVPDDSGNKAYRNWNIYFNELGKNGQPKAKTISLRDNTHPGVCLQVFETMREAECCYEGQKKILLDRVDEEIQYLEAYKKKF